MLPDAPTDSRTRPTRMPVATSDMTAQLSTRTGTVGQPVRRGDIRRINGLLGLHTEPQLALIVRTTNSNQNYADIILVHDRTEMATQDDVILHPDSEQFPHGLVVQPLLRGAVWNLQFSSQLLARLSSDELTAIARTLSRDKSDFDDQNADPLSAATTVSWDAFHDAQLQALWDLTGDCTDAMLDDDPMPWRLDTGLLSRQLLSLQPNPEFIISEVMHILHTRRITATIADSQSLYEYGALEPFTWQDTDYGSNLASQIATGAKKIVECSFRDASRYAKLFDQGAPAFRVPNRIQEARDLALLPFTRLVTASFLWTDSGYELLHHAQDERVHSYPPLEVMMLATLDISTHPIEDHVVDEENSAHGN